MIQFLVTYNFPTSENRDAFYQGIQQNHIQELVQKEEGCIQYNYYFPCLNTQQLFLIEQWETQTHQQLHTKQPPFSILTQLKETYQAVTSINIYECEQLHK